MRETQNEFSHIAVVSGCEDVIRQAESLPHTPTEP